MDINNTLDKQRAMASFSTSAMFEAIAAMIERTTSSNGGIREMFKPYIEYCHSCAGQYNEIWDRIASLDLEADFANNTAWLEALLLESPIPADVNGLWFGLYNPSDESGETISQLYLAGSTRFDAERPYSDWPCSPEYFPENRYAPSAVMARIFRETDVIESNENLLGEACLCQGYAAAMITQWCMPSSNLRTKLIGANNERAVAMGHDSGDYYFIHLPT